MVQVERNPAEALIEAAGDAGRAVIEHEGLRGRGVYALCPESVREMTQSR